jgi:hypothetical protein
MESPSLNHVVQTPATVRDVASRGAGCAQIEWRMSRGRRKVLWTDPKAAQA